MARGRENDDLSAEAARRRSTDALRLFLSHLDPQLSPSEVYGLALTEGAIEAMAAEFTLLVAGEVRAVLAEAQGPCRVTSLELEKGLIHFEHRGVVVYPGYQFGVNGIVRPAVPKLLAIVRGRRRSDLELALWLCDPSDYAGGGRPVDSLDEIEVVTAAAEGHFGVEW